MEKTERIMLSAYAKFYKYAEIGKPAHKVGKRFHVVFPTLILWVIFICTQFSGRVLKIVEGSDLDCLMGSLPVLTENSIENFLSI